MAEVENLFVVYKTKAGGDLQISKINEDIYENMYNIVLRKKGDICIIPKEILDKLDGSFKTMAEILLINNQKFLKELFEECQKHNEKEKESPRD